MATPHINAEMGDFADVVLMPGDPLRAIHANDEESWQLAADAVRSAMTLSDKAPEATPVVYKRITE